MDILDQYCKRSSNVDVAKHGPQKAKAFYTAVYTLARTFLIGNIVYLFTYATFSNTFCKRGLRFHEAVEA